jgi:hypothetical protein
MSFSVSDTAVNYASTKDGAQNFLNVVNYTAQWASRLLTVNPADLKVLGRVSKGFGGAADSLFLVDFFNNCKKFVSSLTESSKGFAGRTVCKVKNVLYNGLGVISSGVDSLKFVGLVLGKTVCRRFTVLGSGAGAIKSAVDIKNDLSAFSSSSFDKITGSVTLTALKVARTTSFLAVDVLAVLGVLFASLKVGTCILGCLTLGLIGNFAVHFFEQHQRAKYGVPA